MSTPAKSRQAKRRPQAEAVTPDFAARLAAP